MRFNLALWEKLFRTQVGFRGGLGSMVDDFNETPQEVLDALEANLECAFPD
jgi:hypothetical protein